MLPAEETQIAYFLNGKSDITLMLFNHFVNQFKEVGDITLQPAKTMIGISNGNKRIAWITQFGKNSLHVVLPFQREYPDNLCFQKIAPVPGQNQFNHHFRMLSPDDVNQEVMGFMQLAFDEEAC